MGQNFRLYQSGMRADSFAILESAFARRMRERGCALGGDEGYQVRIEVVPGLREGEYSIVPETNGVCASVADDCAAFAAMGEWLTRSLFDGEVGFRPMEAPVSFAPERPVRGMYFATHFHNFYHVAPIEKVYDQIEDVALRGGNTLAVWYDMHHYTSIDQPESVEMIARLKKFLRYAKAIGMQTVLTMLSNESFDGSPQKMRAQSKPQNGYKAVLDGFYGVEICPNCEGGIEEIVRQRRLMLETFRDVQPDFVTFWPYDQGGCTCEKCAPWGANGLLKLYPHFRKVLAEVMPGTGIIFSTWYFDLFIDGEWDAFYKKVEQGAIEGAAYLMDFFPRGRTPECIARGGLPNGMKMLAFPEISMYGARPWGGFGANPLPAFLQESNDQGMPLYDGQMCYSEGIFEDVNKTIMLYACSGRQPDAHKAAADYARMEFFTENTDEIVHLMDLLERALPRPEIREKDTIRYPIESPETVEEAARLADAIDARLSENAQKNWRWRILYLRAKIDEALWKHDGRPSPESDRWLNELKEIYCVTKDTLWVVMPPTADFIAWRMSL